MSVFANICKRILRSPANIILLFAAPLLIILLALATMPSDGEEIVEFSDGASTGAIAVVDHDESELSKALVNTLRKSYNVINTSDDRYRTLLTDQLAQYAIVIPKGFGEMLLRGEVPSIDGYLLTVSEYPYLMEAATESIVRAFSVLSVDSTPAQFSEDLVTWQETDHVLIDNQVPASSQADWRFSLWMGFYAMMLMWTALSSARPMIYDMEHHIYLRIGAAPISAWRYQLQMTLGIFVFCALQSLAFATVISLITGVTGVLFWKTMGAVLLYALFCVGFSVMVSSISPSSSTAMMIGSPVITILAMLGGSFWPIEFMPNMMQNISLFTPTYWFNHALTVESSQQYGISLVFIFAFAVLCLLFGGWKKIQPTRF